MQLCGNAKSRWLAIALPSLTITTHALLVLFFAFHLHNGAGSFDSGVWGFVGYNVLATGWGILGAYGAIKMNRSLISAYATMHGTTLLLSMLALLNFTLPFETVARMPNLPTPRIDSDAICRDVDDGFGWDAQWADRCLMSFVVMRTVAAGVGSLLLAVQWWALVAVWRWGRCLNEQSMKQGHAGDIEKVRQHPEVTGVNEKPREEIVNLHPREQKI